ncbi:hypothetical protein K440DRAFT_619077 [Wilcoxina mikolae CBS 423.85]|nr:hypothetical protein K440DRAFT_619077 [Wilcoxina mikolae CBS 423.85]
MQMYTTLPLPLLLLLHAKATTSHPASGLQFFKTASSSAAAAAASTTAYRPNLLIAAICGITAGILLITTIIYAFIQWWRTKYPRHSSQLQRSRTMSIFVRGVALSSSPPGEDEKMQRPFLTANMSPALRGEDTPRMDEGGFLAREF